MAWPFLMFSSWISCKRIHLVWIFTSEMLGHLLGPSCLWELDLAITSGETIQYSVSAVTRTEIVCICEHLHCRGMISADCLPWVSKSILAAFSVATALKSASDGLFAGKLFAAWPGDRKDRESIVSQLADASCSLPLLQRQKLPWWLLTSGSIWFLFKKLINRKLIHSLAEDPGLIVLLTLLHSNLKSISTRSPYSTTNM